MNRELGQRIRRQRARQGRTLVDLSSAVHRSHGWLSALERGDGNPPAEILTALAVELGDDPADYLRLAGRVALTAENVVPMPGLDPRVASAIEDAVGRAMERLADRLIGFLDERLPGTANGGAR